MVLGRTTPSRSARLAAFGVIAAALRGAAPGASTATPRCGCSRSSRGVPRPRCTGRRPRAHLHRGLAARSPARGLRRGRSRPSGSRRARRRRRRRRSSSAPPCRSLYSLGDAYLAGHDRGRRALESDRGGVPALECRGTVAAIAIPAALWLGSRRAGGTPPRALVYRPRRSRGSGPAHPVAWRPRAGGHGGAIRLALVPLRLRTLSVMLIPALLAVGGLAPGALERPVLGEPQPARGEGGPGRRFGLLAPLMLGTGRPLWGLVVYSARSEASMSGALHLRIGIAPAAALPPPLVAFTSVAVCDRGPSGTIDARVQRATSETRSRRGRR